MWAQFIVLFYLCKLLGHKLCFDLIWRVLSCSEFREIIFKPVTYLPPTELTNTVSVNSNLTGKI